MKATEAKIELELIAVVNRRMVGKGHVADIQYYKSDIPSYDWYIVVAKFSPYTEKGWATTGYAKRNKKGEWTVNMNKKKLREKGAAFVGRSGKYC